MRGDALTNSHPKTGAATEPSGPAASRRGIYSIGAVGSMLGVPPATLRTWQERYAVVSPERTRGGHRLYSRPQVEQLRFVQAEMARGASVADAHRSLAQRLLTEDTVRERDAQGRPRVLVLVAERDEFSAEFIEFLLRTEGFGVEVALDIDHAKRIFDLRSPDLVIVELLVGGGDGEGLCRWLKDRGAGPVLVVSGLDAADRSLRAGADAFLRKPVGHLQLLTAVKDLLGVSAILAREG